MEKAELPPKPPERDDLVKLCASLNQEAADYLVVGGMAIIQLGFLRATEDIDLLIESSVENQRRVKRALEILPDKAVLELADDDFQNYVVVRVADEVVVDLMLSACGVGYAEALPEIEYRTIQNVTIPFASAKLLLRLKQTYRDKDALDRAFLQDLLKAKPTK
jgi:hypothetical protein